MTKDLFLLSLAILCSIFLMASARQTPKEACLSFFEKLFETEEARQIFDLEKEEYQAVFQKEDGEIFL